MKVVVAVVALVIVVLGARKVMRMSDEQAARDRELKITHHVDLAQVEDGVKPTPASPPLPPARTSPVLVELTFLQPGAKAQPFRGHYQIVDGNGIVFTEGEAPADGSSVALVLSPSEYEVRAGTHLKQTLSLRYATSEKQALRIVVPK